MNQQRQGHNREQVAHGKQQNKRIKRLPKFTLEQVNESIATEYISGPGARLGRAFFLFFFLFSHPPSHFFSSSLSSLLFSSCSSSCSSSCCFFSLSRRFSVFRLCLFNSPLYPQPSRFPGILPHTFTRLVPFPARCANIDIKLNLTLPPPQYDKLCPHGLITPLLNCLSLFLLSFHILIAIKNHPGDAVLVRGLLLPLRHVLYRIEPPPSPNDTITFTHDVRAIYL